MNAAPEFADHSSIRIAQSALIVSFQSLEMVRLEIEKCALST